MKKKLFMLALGAICVGGFLASCEKCKPCERPDNPEKRGGHAIITIKEVDAETGVVTRSYDASERNVTWAGEGGDVEISGVRKKAFDNQTEVPFEFQLAGRENVVYKGWTVSYPEDEVPYKSEQKPMVQDAPGLHRLTSASFNVANRHPGEDTHVTLHVEYKRYDNGVGLRSFPENRFQWTPELIALFEKELKQMKTYQFVENASPRPEVVLERLKNAIKFYVENYDQRKASYYESLMQGKLPKITYPYNTDGYGNVYYELRSIKQMLDQQIDWGYGKKRQFTLIELLTSQEYRDFRKTVGPIASAYLPSPQFLEKLSDVYHHSTFTFWMEFPEAPESR